MRRSIQFFAAGAAAAAGEIWQYPCVRRLRQRRLLSFLRWEGLSIAFRGMVRDTKVHLSVEHLQRQVEKGMWEEAVRYVARFVPSAGVLGVEGRIFVHLLRVLKAIDIIVTDAPQGMCVSLALQECLVKHPTTSHALTKLRSILLSLVCSHQFRASHDWKLVRRKASGILTGLAYESAEIRNLLFLPQDDDMVQPSFFMPIGVRQCSNRRRRAKKHDAWIPPSALSRRYLRMRRRLLRSSSDSEELCRDETLQDGPELREEKSWQLGYINKGVHVAQALQAKFGTVTGPADYRISSVTITGTPFIPFPNMVGTTTGSAQHSGFSSVTNAGTSKHPRAKLTTVEEEDLDLKRRRTTGTFAEASLMSAIETEACPPVFSA